MFSFLNCSSFIFLQLWLPPIWRTFRPWAWHPWWPSWPRPRPGTQQSHSRPPGAYPGGRVWLYGSPGNRCPRGSTRGLVKAPRRPCDQSRPEHLPDPLEGEITGVAFRSIQNRSMTHLKTFFFGSFLGIFSMPFSSNGICPDLLTQTTTPKPWLIHHLINEPEKPSENTYKLWFCLQNSVLSLMCKKL